MLSSYGNSMANTFYFYLKNTLSFLILPPSRKSDLGKLKLIKEFLRENFYLLFAALRYIYNFNKPEYDFSSFSVNHVEDTHNDCRVILRKKAS